jgi:SAM-dependent methyltransferase
MPDAYESILVPAVFEPFAADLTGRIAADKPGRVLELAAGTGALALPFDAVEFDIVACQFGVMFFPDKPAGFAEARRALAPGGSYHANTWASLEEHGIEIDFTAAVRAVISDNPPNFLATVPHGYADPDRFAADVRAGGFTNVTVETVTVHGKALTAREIALGYCTGTPTRAGLEERGDLATLTAAIADELERMIGTDAVAPPMAAHVLRATSD